MSVGFLLQYPLMLPVTSSAWPDLVGTQITDHSNQCSAQLSPLLFDARFWVEPGVEQSDLHVHK